ncbi:hypothetical protein KQX54_013948 [Cotesia glomerata]|uniref:Uncharacterized protein n=1 Tax=Cotesia glomerata TaxID=32391 RepID=A0AAV7J8S8_COTGL|nr:hypothetical protein KQX54_013948 [Cotesia glomerata]
MPARCAVPVEEAVTVIKRYLSYFITDTLPAWNSPVWKEISQEPEILKYKWSKESVRTNIKENRRNILTITREQSGYFIEKKTNEKTHDHDEDTDNDNDDDTDANDNSADDDKNDKDYVNKLYSIERPDLDNFYVVIDRNLWNHIKHEHCKRPLQNERRDILRKDKEKGVLGSHNQAANDLLKPGDTQCPVLFSDNILYQLKKELTEQQFGIKP